MAVSNVDLLKNKVTQQQQAPTAPNQRQISFTEVAAPVLPDRPTMRSGQSMADLLGVKYDYDYTQKLFQDAVEKKYANLETESRRTQDMYYDSIANSADMLMGAMRRGDRDAVASGAASGSKAAQEMSALLGISADAGAGATELAQARGDLVYKRESELAQVAKDALKYYNDLGISLGQLSASELNALVTAYASEVATIGGIYNTDVLAGVEQDRIASTEWIADQDRFSRDNIAYWANLTNKEVAHIQGAYGLDAEEIRKQAQIQAANISADASRYNADKNFEANKYSADKNYAASVYSANKSYRSSGSSSGGSSGSSSQSSNIDAELERLYAVKRGLTEKKKLTDADKRLLEQTNNKINSLTFGSDWNRVNQIVNPPLRNPSDGVIGQVPKKPNTLTDPNWGDKWRFW